MKIEEPQYWRALHGERGDYNITSLIRDEMGMDALRAIFPAGGVSVNKSNFVLFSTSGVHGTYDTIEETKSGQAITFLVVPPRLVALRYGGVIPETLADYYFLKDLRAASWRVVLEIGRDETTEPDELTRLRAELARTQAALTAAGELITILREDYPEENIYTQMDDMKCAVCNAYFQDEPHAVDCTLAERKQAYTAALASARGTETGA